MLYHAALEAGLVAYSFTMCQYGFHTIQQQQPHGLLFWRPWFDGLERSVRVGLHCCQQCVLCQPAFLDSFLPCCMALPVSLPITVFLLSPLGNSSSCCYHTPRRTSLWPHVLHRTWRLKVVHYCVVMLFPILKTNGMRCFCPTVPLGPFCSLSGTEEQLNICMCRLDNWMSPWMHNGMKNERMRAVYWTNRINLHLISLETSAKL